MISNFFLLGPAPAIIETGTYIPFLVLVSYVVASLAAYTVLDLATYVSLSKDPQKSKIWQYCGAFAMGAGIWSMHFIGMLAYKMDMAIEYNYALTFTSMIPPIIGSYFVLEIIKKAKISTFSIFSSSTLLGIGIASMHYTGMAAMKMDADILYDPVIFTLSILIAIAASAVAIIIAFLLTYRIKKRQLQLKIVAALIMGLAICGMHYTGMAATVFIPWANCRYDPEQNFMILALTIAFVTFIILSLALFLRIHLHSSTSLRQNQETLSLVSAKSSAVTFFILGLCLSLFASYFVHDMHIKEKIKEYQQNTTNFTEKFKDRVNAHIETLESIERFYSASTNVTVPEFTEYTAPIIEESRDITGIYFIANQPNENDKTITYKVQFSSVLSSSKVNKKIRNFSNIPNITNIFDHTMTTNMAIIGPSFNLVKSGEVATDTFTLLLKVYARANIKDPAIPGLVAIEIDPRALISLIHEKTASLSAIQIDLIKETDPNKKSKSDNYIEKEITIGKSSWLLAFTPTTTVFKHDKYAEFIIILIGAILSFMLASYTYIILRQREKHLELNIELEEEKNQLKTILDNMMQAVITTDADGSILTFNKWAENIFEYKAKDIIGKNISLLTPPMDTQDDTPYVLNHFEQGQTNIIGTGREINAIKSDGTDFPVFLSIVEITKDGVKNFVGLIMDMTEIKEKERKLEHAKRQADQANNAKSDFLANMSHELRTPLNSILGMTRMLAEDMQLNEENKSMTETILKSSTNLLEIVNNILDVSKIESGNMIIESIAFDLHDVVQNVIEAMAPISSAKGVSLSCQYKSGEIPFLIGDPFRINRILTNLIGNAIKYTNKDNGSGSVTVIIESHPINRKKLSIGCSVLDSGIGIHEDKIDQIFDKFIQADVSNTRQFGGTGLGLSITKDLVKLMGGEIGVISKPGEGSCFWFDIPFEITEKIDDEDKKKVKKERRKEKRLPHENRVYVNEARLLIAEDHLLNQDFLKKLLKRMGFNHLDIVDNGKLAVEAFLKGRYHLILMDCHMPEKNGYEATLDIRSSGVHNGDTIPIIALTADAMKGTKEKCIEVGMNEYTDKPIDPPTLKSIMEQWIDFSAPQEIGDEKSMPEPEISISPKADADQTVDLSLLKEYADTPEDLSHFIVIFKKQSDESIEILRENTQGGDNTVWSDAAHKFKGGAGMIGAKKLHKLCAKGQEMNPASEEERKALFAQIEEEYERVKDFLKDYE